MSALASLDRVDARLAALDMFPGDELFCAGLPRRAVAELVNAFVATQRARYRTLKALSLAFVRRQPRRAEYGLLSPQLAHDTAIALALPHWELAGWHAGRALWLARALERELRSRSLVDLVHTRLSALWRGPGAFTPLFLAERLDEETLWRLDDATPIALWTRGN